MRSSLTFLSGFCGRWIGLLCLAAMSVPALAISGILTLAPGSFDCDEATLRGRITVNDGPNAGWAVFFASESPDGPWDYWDSPYATTGQAWSTDLSSDTIEISQAIRGLKGGTTYYYKIYATDQSATGEYLASNTASFTTLPVPTSVTSDAKPVGVTTATLVGEVTPVAGFPTSAYFEYWLGGTIQSTPKDPIGSVATPQAVVRDITGLLPNSIYYYRVVGERDGCGKSYGATQSFFTKSPPAIVTQPVSPPLPVYRGESVEFSVEATGDNLEYQWYERLDPSQPYLALGGETDTTLVITAQYHASYQVVVSNPGGPVFSNEVGVEVKYRVGWEFEPPPVTDIDTTKIPSYDPLYATPSADVTRLFATAATEPASTEIGWRNSAGDVIVRVSAIVEALPGQSVLLAQPILPPEGLTLGSTPPLVEPSGAAFWNGYDGALYATSNGMNVTITWFNEASTPVLSTVDIAWPDPVARADLYQTHISGAPVELGGGGGFAYARVTDHTGVDSATVDGLLKFEATGEGRSLLMLSSGDPTDSPVYFQFVQTVPYATVEQAADDEVDIGKAINLTSDIHNSTFGGPLVINALSHYCPRFYDPASRTGSIFPVNTDGPGVEDDLVIVGYQPGNQLFNPATGLTIPSNLGWPSIAVHYQAVWGVPDETIILASPEPIVLLSLGTANLGIDNSPELYVQNDPGAPGFNPNDEHAWLGVGENQSTVYALRNDLSSDPHVLVTYTNSSLDPAMAVIKVEAELGELTFANTNTFRGVAGTKILTPAALTPAKKDPLLWWKDTFWPEDGIGFKDRRDNLWAKSAGDDGGTNKLVLRYFYPTEPDFYFPQDYAQYLPGGLPADGLLPDNTLVPWLDLYAGTPGVPQDVTFTIEWPEDPELLDVAQTLLETQSQSLQAASAEVIYQQSTANGEGPSVVLFDAGVRQTVPVSTDLWDLTAFERVGSLDRRVFPQLPSSLRPRLWYDRNSQTLNLEPEIFDVASPEPMLLLSVLSARDVWLVTNNVSQDPSLKAAIDQLTDVADAVVPVEPDQFLEPLTIALHAGLGRRTGYVTIAANNSTEVGNQNLDPQLYVFKIRDQLYPGVLKLVQRDEDSPLSELLTVRFNGDFAGRVDDYIFEWERHDGDGVWRSVAEHPQYPGQPARGRVEITLVGTLADVQVRCRYRPIEAPDVNESYTAWTDVPAPGWIQRATTGLNAFDVEFGDVWETMEVNGSVISQAGEPYYGQVPFNQDAVDRAGLIQLYATVLQRGLDLSLEATPPLAYDPNGNKGLYQALIRAAGKLGDLYLLLGHEALADALDPTIGIGTDLRVDATSLFCFENGTDIKSLLDEELALLRGRTSGGSALDQPPEFNRLKANIGDPALETAYVNNYNIRAYGTNGTDLTAEDARREYPQGHGDAWGHYLSAVKGYYQLLTATNFAWFTTNEEIVVPDLGKQLVNYNYERKFAIAAAAKSKTGAEIVNLTYRKLYQEDPAQQFQGYPDTVDPERAWGLSDWASRTGQGALFDWVTINALLPAHSTNANLERVDRETVQELAEIAANFDEIQGESDKADSGLNPLGLAKNVVPFGGVSAAAIADGETHFEQIHRRAVGALKNTAAVFDYANQATQMLRRQDNDEAAFQQQIDERRTDYLNRLIEIFGTPYEEDPNYTDKNVPDVYNYMLIDRTSFTGEPEPISRPLTIRLWEAVLDEYGVLSTPKTNSVTYQVAEEGLQLVKPPGWTRRAAPGEIQRSLANLVQQQMSLERGLVEYENLLAQIEDEYGLLRRQYGVQANEIYILEEATNQLQTINDRIASARRSQLRNRSASKMFQGMANAFAEAMPAITGIANDLTSVLRSWTLLGGVSAAAEFDKLADDEALAELNEQFNKEQLHEAKNLELIVNRNRLAIQQQVAQLEGLVRQEATKSMELNALVEGLQQSANDYRTVLARGLRLLEESRRFERQTANQIRQLRYRDMAFRVFRNDALQKYRAQFDLAARYVYLSAAAFDYETSKLGEGSDFLEEIVGKRAIGWMGPDGPISQDSHDPGLAGVLADLDQAFQNFSDNRGWDQEVTREKLFSLRAGWFRIPLSGTIPGAPPPNEVWKETLRRHRVDNLWDIPEFRRYCRPPRSEPAGGEPGLVIEFPSRIDAELNFFGLPVASGEGSRGYNATFFATRISAVGIWFSNYDTTSQGLAVDPYVYLVPVGADVLRAPDATDWSTREWQVMDQFLPEPVDFETTPPNYTENWLPMVKSLDLSGELSGFGFGAIRRHSAIDVSMYSQFDGGSKIITDSRLVGRSAWNTRWLLIIPAISIYKDSSNLEEGLERFIEGPVRDNGQHSGFGVSDIKLYFLSYHISGN